MAHFEVKFRNLKKIHSNHVIKLLKEKAQYKI